VTRRLRELRTPEERHLAAAEAHAWGYPRTIRPDEIEGSVWLRYGPDVIWWLQQDTDCEDNEIRLHVCVAPGARSRVYPRRWMTAVEVVAELLPGDFGQLRVTPTGAYEREVAGYLERWGWTRGGGGWYKRLPGVNHGKAVESEPSEAAADDRQGGRGGC
jgi:hypothetical protein